MELINRISVACLKRKSGFFIKRGDELMNQRGVTLMELLIVFVIIAIGAALMAPNIGGWLPNFRLGHAGGPAQGSCNEYALSHLL
jgi:prepilin-type N-terminal cleavage/methylation domain-containing protein